ncbi:hypothetical protein BKE38_12230 [Pseudoroseomonas deserti]|uniref:Uncharacterized protein n=1 Tax=Teichococcus deserti TaxID=1817963 RepID=A0A1V2H1Z9_9PROT|nr:hypothetical protein [Pseudoroseomonas deserti]ONG53374.1 hypothetical protein BKE38_12230 [Pseudoroseomonas deserti]
MPDTATKPSVKPPAQIGLPRMSPAELLFFRRLLDDGGFSRYGEFGLGGSTLEAVRRPIPMLVSVESDADWLQAASDQPEIAAAITAGRLTLRHGDIGPVVAWGRPRDSQAMARWPDYVATFWEEWSRRGALPQLVFVDGRFRVAAALSALLQAGDDPPAVLVHDMVEARLRHYGAMLGFLEPVAQVETLWLLRARPKLDRAALLAAFLRHALDFR